MDLRSMVMRKGYSSIYSGSPKSDLTACSHPPSTPSHQTTARAHSSSPRRTPLPWHSGLTTLHSNSHMETYLCSRDESISTERVLTMVYTMLAPTHGKAQIHGCPSIPMRNRSSTTTLIAWRLLVYAPHGRAILLLLYYEALPQCRWLATMATWYSLPLDTR